MKGKLFLVAMLVIGLVVGMAALGFVGCETDTTPASTPNNGRTIVLRNVTTSNYVRVHVFPAGANINTAAYVGSGGGLVETPVSGGEVAIDVQPSNGSFLAEIPYQVKVDVDGTVKYKDSVSFEMPKVEIDWQLEMISPPTYGISLVPSGSHIFKPGEAPLSVSIKNDNAAQATGALTVTISDPASFTLNGQTEKSITIASIAGGGSTENAFSVQPKRGLNADEEMYAALVEVTGENNISDSLLVIFTEDETEAGGNDYSTGISLSTIGHHKFAENNPAALSVDVTNTSAEDATGKLTITVSNSESFELSHLTIASIQKGETLKGAFTVKPKSGLSGGTHAAIVEVKGENGIFGFFTVSFTVKTADKIARTAEEVKIKLADASLTEVEYRGTEPLTGITVPAGKTLVITETITGQTAKIEKADTGTITNNGTIGTTTTDKNVLANLVGFAGTGKVVLTGAVTDVTAPLVLGVNLEIGAGGSINFTGSDTAAFSGGKAVTIAEGGTLNLGAITEFGADIDNKGTITTTATGVTDINDILEIGGNITVNDVTVAATDTLKIPNNTMLTITGTLNNTKGGTIEVLTATKLVEVLDSLKTKLNGNVTVNKTGSVTLSSSVTIPQDVTLILSTEQTLNVSETGTLTVNSGAKLIVEEGGEINVDGTITLDSGGEVEGLTLDDGTVWGTTNTIYGDGSLVVKKGGKVYTANGSQLVSDDEPGTTDPDVIFELTGDENGTDSFTLTKGGYALDGAATLHSKFSISKVFSLSATSKLTIDTSWGGETDVPSLSISAGASITGASITGTDASSAQIIVSAGNTITPATSNFYDSNGLISDEVMEGIYEWTANADRNGNPGWLKAK
jgi:hypothetical protein